MRLKIFSLCFLAALMLACKRPSQATPPVNFSLPSSQANEQVNGSPNDLNSTVYDDEQEIRRRSPKSITEEYYSCIKAAGYNPVESMTCMSAEVERQDNRLNDTYKNLLTKLDTEAKKKILIEAQRAWIEFRTSEENFEASIAGTEIIDNAQLSEDELFRLVERANALEKHLRAVEL